MKRMGELATISGQEGKWKGWCRNLCRKSYGFNYINGVRKGKVMGYLKHLKGRMENGVATKKQISLLLRRRNKPALRKTKRLGKLQNQLPNFKVVLQMRFPFECILSWNLFSFISLFTQICDWDCSSNITSGLQLYLNTIAYIKNPSTCFSCNHLS